jgi:hypothetical protein
MLFYAKIAINIASTCTHCASYLYKSNLLADRSSKFRMCNILCKQSKTNILNRSSHSNVYKQLLTHITHKFSNLCNMSFKTYMGYTL